MFTMTIMSRTDQSLTLAVAGNVNERALAEIERSIRRGRERRQNIVLDLSEVTLIDHAAARFFAETSDRGFEVVNCPEYLQHWISRETALNDK